MPIESPGAPSVFSSKWNIRSAVAGLVVTLSLIDAGQTHVSNAIQGRPISLARALLIGCCLWFPLGGLIWPTVWLARRFRFDSSLWRRNLAIHLLAAACFACVMLLSASLLRVGFGLRTSSQFIGDISIRFGWLFGVDFFMYWAVVGSYYSFHFYHLAKERELAATQLRVTLTESRLRALRAQLNPHFLFNALNAISVLAMHGEQKAVVGTIAQLGELLRVSLDDELPERVPLAAELRFLDGYLDIQRVRFADRLTIDQEIGAETLQALVPSLILQPLVENAIVHGIAARSGPGRISIRASRENGTLRVSVGDSGPGFTGQPAAPPRKGIGLTNTRERLFQLYGAEHHIETGRAADGGGVVVFLIPFQELPEASLS